VVARDGIEPPTRSDFGTSSIRTHFGFSNLVNLPKWAKLHLGHMWIGGNYDSCFRFHW
jgi:hypothetical protein